MAILHDSHALLAYVPVRKYIKTYFLLTVMFLTACACKI